MDVSKTISLEILFTPMIDIGFWTTLAQVSEIILLFFKILCSEKTWGIQARYNP